MAIYRGVGGSGDSATGEDVFGDNSSITSLNGLSGAIQTPTYIKFAPNANHTANQGELTWNTAEGTLDLGLNHGGVVLQIGQELHYRVTNQSGADIPNGTLVAFVGTTGNSGKLLVNVYDGTQASKAILGLTTETIVNGTNGYVTSFGKVRGIQTNGSNYGETWVDGDILYPSPTGLTNILPQAPAAKQAIAVVVHAHGSNGELFVRVQGHTSIEDDELVQLTSLTNGDVLQYDSVDGRFENRSLSSAGIQPTLVSGVNIKTINSESLLGSTDIAVTTAADIANMLETSDIGVTVQGYDANTAKYNDVTANFTGTLQNGGSNVVVDSDIGSSVLAYDSNLQGFVNTFTLPTTDGSNGFVLTTNGAGTLSFSVGGGGIADGDKGDITVSSGGTVWTIDNGAVSLAKTTGVAGSGANSNITSLTNLTGNITFTGTGNRITGDFSNATPSNRVAFQSSTVNGNTLTSIIPNGTATTSSLEVISNSDPTNASYTSIAQIGTTESRIQASRYGTGTNCPLTFYTAQVERMRIDTSGNVGIGTSSPGGKLDVTVNTASTTYAQVWNVYNGATFQFSNTLGGDSTNGVYFGPYQSVPLRFVINNTERMRIDSSGNVGIGTSSPYSRFHVSDTGGADGTITLGSSPTTGYYAQVYQNINYLDLIANGDQAYRASLGTNNGTGNIRFFTASGTTGNTERMRIDSSGNVLVTNAAGLGYGTGAGGTVTQATSRTTGVTLNKPTGAITMFTAAGSTTAATFTVTNSLVNATDTIILSVKSSTNLYDMFVSAVAAGSFNITFRTTGGTSSDTPVINFAIIKGATS